MKNLSILALAVMAFGMFGCKKLNTIDNSSTIKQPYVLYIGGQFGNLQKTNDAENFDTPFFGDGSISYDVIVADTNIIHVRNKIHVANSNKPLYATVTDPNFTVRFTNTLSGKYVNNTLYDAANKNIYVLVTTTKGIAVGINNGKTFSDDPNMATANQNAATSITQLANKNIYIRTIDNRIFVRNGGLLTNIWTEVLKVNNDTIPFKNTSSVWILGSVDNRLVAIHKLGQDTAMYSDNGGVNWFPLAGLPDSVTTQCVKTCVLNNKLYVGTDSAGLWRLDGTTFVKSSNGLPGNARIFDIVSKRNVYRTDVSKDYYFLATDNGLFMSDFNGTQWKQVNNKACMAFD
jgi:hypothetical protein